MKTETAELIQNHRSIRKYSDKPIDDSILNELLVAAQWAPSSHNIQAYSIIVVKNEDTKNILSDYCGSQEWVRTCPVFLVFCADFYRLKTACEMNDSPYALNGVENLIVGAVDAALSAENVYISAKSYGLGGVMIGGIRNNSQEVVDLLKLPEYVIPIVGMCLGYPDQEPWQKPRLPQDIVVHNEEYNTKIIKEGLMEYDNIMSDYYFRRTNGQRDKGWTELMAEYLRNERRPDLKEFIINQGIKLI